MNPMKMFLASACAGLMFGPCAFAQLTGVGIPIIHAQGPSLVLDHPAVQKEIELIRRPNHKD